MHQIFVSECNHLLHNWKTQSHTYTMCLRHVSSLRCAEGIGTEWREYGSSLFIHIFCSRGVIWSMLHCEVVAVAHRDRFRS